MKRNNLFKRIIEKYKEYRQKNFINTLIIKKQKQIKIRKIFKKKDFSISFYRTFFDILLSGIGKKYLIKYIYPKILDEDKKIDINQKKLLSVFLDTIKDTKIGKNYEVRKIIKSESNQTYKLFSQLVPVSDYEDFKEFIQDSKLNENIIRPGKISRFSASSGTTDKKKNIPVSSESLESTSKAGVNILAEYFFKYPETNIFKGDFLPLAGSIQEYKNNITIADISALLVLDRGKFSQKKYALDPIYLIHPQREIKRELALKKLNPNKTITMMGVSSWAYEILRYIQKKDKKMFDIMIKNMELIIGGGVDVSPYISYFKKLNLKYIGVYNASEGIFGYQDIINYDNSQGKSPYKLLPNHGVFFEFIEFNNKNFDNNGKCKKNAETKPVREITKKDINKKYAIIITTNSGLMRYIIGDVIQFVDENKRFIISGRTRQSLNLKGEELMETHISKAIQELSNKYNINILYYTIGPDKIDNPEKHQRIIETQDNISISPNTIIKYIDKNLQEINPDYEAKRKNDILLKLPEIIFAKKGTFYNRLKSQNKLGGQFKIPKLSNDRKYLDEILKIIK